MTELEHDRRSDFTHRERFAREQIGARDGTDSGPSSQVVASWEHTNELEDDARRPDNHQHHVPEHCPNTFCLNCGRGGPQAAACIGCLRVIASAYERLTMEPDTSRYESPVKPYNNCIEGHDPEMYCSGCAPKTHKNVQPQYRLDEVGTFDIGKPPSDAMRTLKDLHNARERAGDPFTHVTLDELRESPVYGDKSPGFEGGGLHYDGGKPPLSLVPRAGVRAVAEVFAFGASKYAQHNWRQGILWSRILDSAYRHLTDFIDGYDLDPESGLNHLAHAAWNCFAILEYMETHPELDDRYAPPSEGAEAQYEDDDLNQLSRQELYDLIRELE